MSSDSNSEYELYYAPHITDKKVSILDVGCGYGDLLTFLKERGFENIRGIEVDEERIKVARSKGLTVDDVGDLEPWLAGKRFDVIILRYSIAHIHRDKISKYISSIRDSLQDKGILMLDITNASLLTGFYTFCNSCEHTQYFTEYSAKELLQRNGFSDVAVVGKKLRGNSVTFILWNFARTLWIAALKVIFILERGVGNNPTIWDKSFIVVAKK